MSQFTIGCWLDPRSGPESGFRNKAKMVVSGAAHAPILGIIGPTGEAVSLCDCGLYPDDMQQLLHRLQTFIRQAGIPPYNIAKSKGELKYILLTRSHFRGEFLLRFVLRSEYSIERINNALPQLLADFPQIKVISVNIQPIHMAVLEGEQEIYLSEATTLEERFNDVPLFIRPKSFFQTNPVVASMLYQTARSWINNLQPESIWDLFCGVGGFGLHCATPDTKLTGIEIESEAIACAQKSAQMMGLKDVEFVALDLANFTLSDGETKKPEVIIVNPPRRGLGESLCNWLNEKAPKTILYSSCNAATLADDLARLEDYQVSKVQLFDMFPHTEHYEVLTLLIRN